MANRVEGMTEKLQEQAMLESACAQVSSRYGCGIYILTVDDHSVFTEDVFEAAYTYYDDYSLGEGAERNGVFLLLSMAYRDYALYVYGDGAEYAFNMGGQISLEEAFLPFLGEDRWYDGFAAYVSTCDEYLLLAENGEPVRMDVMPLLPVVILGALVIALIVCSILRAGMKNVSAKTEADAYTVGSLQLSRRIDRYTHTSTSRVKIESSSSGSSGGSRARTGGGGSGRSGKF